jgi:hypothetical protein
MAEETLIVRPDPPTLLAVPVVDPVVQAGVKDAPQSRVYVWPKAPVTRRLKAAIRVDFFIVLVVFYQAFY